MTDLDLKSMTVCNKPHADLDALDKAIIEARRNKIRDSIRAGKKTKMPENVITLEGRKPARLREYNYR